MSDSTERKRAARAAWRKKNPEQVKVQRRRYYRLYKEKIKQRVRRWRDANPEKKRENARLKNLKKYGLTGEAFTALLTSQANRCAICKIENGYWVVDHDHRTGKVRGILCRNCNLGLGGFRDKPEALLSAVTYLKAS